MGQIELFNHLQRIIIITYLKTYCSAQSICIKQEYFVNRITIVKLAQSTGVEIHRLLLCRGVRPPTTYKCPAYDTKQSDGVISMMHELLGMRSTPSLPFLPGPLWPGVVAPDRALPMGKIELNCVLMLN